MSTPVSWCFPSHCHPYCLNPSSRELRDMLAQGYRCALCSRLGSCLEDIQMLLISALFSFEVWRKNEREKRISLHVCFVGNHLSLTSRVSFCFDFLLLLHTLSHVSFQPPKWLWSQLIEGGSAVWLSISSSVLGHQQYPFWDLVFALGSWQQQLSLQHSSPIAHDFIPWFLHKYTCCALHHVGNLGSVSLLYN